MTSRQTDYPMSRIFKALLLSLALTTGIPVILPDGTGSTYLPWQKLRDPLTAWQQRYFLDPYRSLYQSAMRRWHSRDTDQAKLDIYQDAQGVWHVSNQDSNTHRAGKTLRLNPTGNQLLRPGNSQAWLAFGVTAGLLFIACYILLTPIHIEQPGMLENLRERLREKKRAEEQYQLELARKKAAESINFSSGNPYSFLGVRDDTPTHIIRDTYLARLATLSPEKLRHVAPSVRADAQKEIARIEQAWAMIRKHRKLDS